MNITRIINVVGQLQSLLAVLDQLPPATQREVVGTLKSNGIDPALLAKQAVRTKHTLQAMPAETFVPMLRISALHLDGKSRRQVLEGTLPAAYGLGAQCTPWGALLKFDQAIGSLAELPRDIQELKAWAADAEVTWVLVHVDYPTVAGLQLFEDAAPRILAAAAA